MSVVVERGIGWRNRRLCVAVGGRGGGLTREACRGFPSTFIKSYSCSITVIFKKIVHNNETAHSYTLCFGMYSTVIIMSC